MSECKDWRRAIGKNELLDETVEIDVIFRETAHAALATIGQRAVRHPLPAPVAPSDLTRRDRTGWLGRVDSNLCISESEFVKTLSLGGGFEPLHIEII
jgi:hypothetical protein